MKKIFTVFVMLILCTTIHARSDDWKEMSHYITLPLIQGTGIFSSIATLSHADHEFSKVMGATNLTVLGTNAAIGLITAFAPPDQGQNIHLLHRIMGFGVSAAAISLAVSLSIDESMQDSPARYVSYGYAPLTVVPLVVFAF